MLSYTNKEIFEREEKPMSKKVKVLISALVVTVLLTVGATATVMAEGEEETTPPPEVSEKGLLDRVADILESAVLIKPWKRSALLESKLMKS